MRRAHLFGTREFCERGQKAARALMGYTTALRRCVHPASCSTGRDPTQVSTRRWPLDTQMMGSIGPLAFAKLTYLCNTGETAFTPHTPMCMNSCRVCIPACMRSFRHTVSMVTTKRRDLTSHKGLQGMSTSSTKAGGFYFHSVCREGEWSWRIFFISLLVKMSS